MGLRLDLHTRLLTICPNVYFQPPTNIQMKYPCIIYKRDLRDTLYANDKPYKHEKRYMVMVIDRDPDSPLPELVADLPKSSFDRFYTADDLNHDVYSVYF
jgi:hypothetical protein